MVKPFIKWAGGKSQLITQIEKDLPEGFDDMQNTTYIEPFVGGGAMLFYMLSHRDNITQAIINDINLNLITSYRTIQARPESLIDRLTEIQTEYLALDEEQRRDYFYNKREVFNGDYTNDVEKMCQRISKLSCLTNLLMCSTCKCNRFALNCNGETLY